jgi:hypothetical protein
MQEISDQAGNGAPLDIPRIGRLLDEAKATARAMYEAYHDPSAAEGIHALLNNTFDALFHELGRVGTALP